MHLSQSLKIAANQFTMKRALILLFTLFFGIKGVDAQVMDDHWYFQSTDKTSWIFVRDIGSGEPVIVIHGGPGMPHDYLLPIYQGLEDEFKFVFYDQRGSRSSPTRDTTISIDDHIIDLETLRESIGVKKINVVSHSAGSYILYEYLKKHPEKIKNAIFLGAVDPKNGKKEFFTQDEYRSFEVSDQQKKKFRERDEVQYLIDSLGFNRSDLNPKQQYDLRRIKSAAANIFDIRKWRQVEFFFANALTAKSTMESIDFQYDHTELLSNSKNAITVINGQYDIVIGGFNSPIWSSFVRFNAPNIELKIIDNAGHLIWIDQPNKFQIALKEALRSGIN